MKAKELFFAAPPKLNKSGMLYSNYALYIHSYNAK